MAQFSTDFSEYTTGVQPADWTKRWDTNCAYTVESAAGALGGKVLQMVPSSIAWRFLSWDDLDVAGNADGETLFKFRFDGTTATILEAIRRGAGTVTTMEGYGATPRDASSARIFKHTTTSALTIRNVAYTFVINTWYWMRVQNLGDTHRARVWADGESEPGGWLVYSITDNTYLGDGWIGVGPYRSGQTSEIDYFAVGTDSDPAPGPSGLPVTDLEGDYLEEFAGFAHGALPSDWSLATAGAASADASIAIDGGASRGRRFRLGSTSSVTGYIWDAPPAMTDCEVVAVFGVRTSNTTAYSLARLALRYEDLDATNSNGYEFLVRTDGAGVQLIKRVVGTPTVLATDAAYVVGDLGGTGFGEVSERHRVRIRIEGTSIKVRIWGFHDAEPGTWNMEVTDSDISSAGKILLGQVAANGYSEYDTIAVTGLGADAGGGGGGGYAVVNLNA